VSDLDCYDVEAMIRDALYAERAVWRGEIAELENKLNEALGSERVERQDALESLERVVASRTEHLA
jgi:hypothetical protein